MSIGSTIKSLRRTKDITQEQLAEYLGITSRAVSQWECERTVPDIYMLPIIASFFNVSIDYLFYSDKDEYEANIKEYENKYYHLWHQQKNDELLYVMKEAISKYPNEYRLLVRYLNVIDRCSLKSDFAISIKNEANSIYERIISHCTIDNIRIWAKKIMISYYKKLISFDSNEISFSELEKIKNELPLMQNTRDYMACFLYTDKEQETACYDAVAEMIYLMTNVIYNNYIYNPIYTLDERIFSLEKIIEINDVLFENGGYGKNTGIIAYTMMRLGCFYHEKGNFEKAQALLHKCLDFAKKVDTSEDSLTCQNGLLNGFSINKRKVPYLTSTPLSEEIENFIVQHKKINI